MDQPCVSNGEETIEDTHEHLHFDAWKSRVLAKRDQSRKGALDARIAYLVERLNEHADFVSTSSCSGRILLYSLASPNAGKQHCCWHWVSHEPLSEPNTLWAKLQEAVKEHNTEMGSKRLCFLKFEPFILHVSCRCLASARSLCSIAKQCGFKNSGITFGDKVDGKITVAVRGCLSFELPAISDHTVLVSQEYSNVLTQCISEKFSRNECMISKLETMINVLWLEGG